MDSETSRFSLLSPRIFFWGGEGVGGGGSGKGTSMQTRSNGSIVENTNFCPAGLGMFDVEMNIRHCYQLISVFNLVKNQTKES